MARKTSIHGIFLAVELDKQAMRKLAETLSQSLEKINQQIHGLSAIKPRLDSTSVTKSLEGIITSFTRVKEHANNVQEVFTKLPKILNDPSLTNQLNSLGKQFGTTGENFKNILERAFKTGQVKNWVSAVEGARRAAQMTKNEMLAFLEANKQSFSPKLIEAVRDKYESTAKSIRKVSSAAKEAADIVGVFNQILSSLGVYVSIQGLTQLVKSMYDTSVQVNTLSVAFQAVEGSADLAAIKMEFIRKESEALGLNYLETAKAAKTFYAAANLSPIAKEADKIFHSFSEAATALHLSKEEVSGMFLAISQMMSKGKITAEELRLQLAERLPGAVQMLAKAMKINTFELDKMLKDGKVGIENLVLLAEEAHKTYGAAAKNASNSVIAELNRVSNAWFEFKEEFNLAENFASVLGMLRSTIDFLKEHGRTLSNIILLWVNLTITAKGFFAILGLIGKGLNFVIKPLIMLKTIPAIFTKWGTGALTAAVAGKKLAASFGLVSAAGTKLVPILTKIPALAGLTYNALLGWAAIPVTILAIAGAFYTWYKSAHQASKELKALEQSYENFKNKKIDVEVEINGTKIKKEAIEDQIDKNAKAIQDFVNKRKIEWSVSANKEQLIELKTELANLGDSFNGGTAAAEKYRNELEQHIERLQNHINSSQNATSAVEDFKNAGIDLANEVRNGLMTQEEANEKLAEAKDKALEAANGNTDLQASINALFGPMSSLIGQCDAVAVAMGGMAQMARVAKAAFLELSGLNIKDSLLSKTQELKDAVALMRMGVSENEIKAAQGISGSATKVYLNPKATQEDLRRAEAERVANNPKLMQAMINFRNSENKIKAESKKGLKKWFGHRSQTQAMIAISGLREEYNKAGGLPDLGFTGKETPQQIQEKLLSDKRGIEYLDRLISGTKETLAASKGQVEAQALYNAAKKGPKSGGGSKKGSKAKSGSTKSTVAQEKKDMGVKNTLESLEREKVLLEKIRDIGEDNTVERAFLEIEEAVTKANLAANNYLKTNMDATNQAEVQKVAELMRSNAAIKAETKRNKLLEDELIKVRQLISSYNEEHGLYDTAGIELINQEYEKQVAVLNTLIEKYKEAKNAKAEAEAREAIEVLGKEKEKKELFKEKGLEASFKQAYVDYEEKYADITKQMRDIWSGSLDSMGDALAEFVSSGDLSFSSLAESFHSLAKSILADMTKVMMHQFVRYFIGAVGSWFGGAAAGGASTSGGMFGGGTTGAGMSLPVGNYTAGMTWAKGGAFGGGSLSSYTNSIVNTPTMFSYGTQRFARGGVMGEAGPEAIMPLTRTANGNLGVRAVGNGSDNVTVNVYNYGNEKARTRESRNSQGGRSIDVIIGDITAQQMTTPGTKLNRAVTAQTGASQPTIRR